MMNHQKTSSEVEDEMRFHLEMLERKYAQQGMSIADAKAAALRRFGNLEAVKQQRGYTLTLAAGLITVAHLANARRTLRIHS